MKKLFPVHGIDEVAFINEFRNHMYVEHKNIVRLIGYCYEIAHKYVHDKGQLVFAKVIDRALCFEYMPKGSLSQHLSGMIADLSYSLILYFSLQLTKITSFLCS